MMLLLFEAILFGMFTGAMLTEQLSSIIADQTGIERIKHDYTPQNRSTLPLQIPVEISCRNNLGNLAVETRTDRKCSLALAGGPQSYSFLLIHSCSPR